MVHVLDIDETFRIEGRGLVLVAFWVPSCTETIRNGDKIELRNRSGKSFQTTIKAIEMIRADPRSDGQIPLGLMVADEPPITGELKDAQVWKV
jgi:hypothetical protein